MLRTDLGWEALVPLLRLELSQLGGLGPPYGFSSMQRYLDNSFAEIRLVSFLYFSLACIGLFLAKNTSCPSSLSSWFNF